MAWSPELNASEGAQVGEGALLARIEKGERAHDARRAIIEANGRFWATRIRDHQPHRTVTETDNLLISTLTHNPQPLHLDAELCRRRPNSGGSSSTALSPSP